MAAQVVAVAAGTGAQNAHLPHSEKTTAALNHLRPGVHQTVPFAEQKSACGSHVPVAGKQLAFATSRVPCNPTF